MPDWQERITRETAPAIRVEHDLRYRLAVPLIIGAGTWCDLGCGNGIAAADALAGSFGGRAILVDVEEEVVAGAERELGGADTVGVVCDLSLSADLERVRRALGEGDGGGASRAGGGAGGCVITCFEVIEHLETFVALLEMVSELARAGEATTLLSVPNDAFWAIENPHHRTMWGEGAFAELRSLLPPGHVVARQVALQGSAVAAEAQSLEASVAVALGAGAGPGAGVATHFLVALGPRAGELQAGIGAVDVSDLEAQRRWERQRESNLLFLQDRVEEVEGILRSHVKQFDEWRTYIHSLEARLGKPPSGSAEGQALEAGAPTHAGAPADTATS